MQAKLTFVTMEIFVMTEQPITCPLCGTRVEIMYEFEMDALLSQLCKCPNIKCRYIFIEQEGVACKKQNKMNIKFSYLYRDGSNYKQFNEIVFSNPRQIPLEKIDSFIRANLISGFWFIAKDWNLPCLNFREYAWDDKIDHGWHEFESVKVTMEIADQGRYIEKFLRLILRIRFKL